MNQAVYSAQLEGLTVSSEFRVDAQAYIEGQISADELVELTRERFGLTGAQRR